jgi:hypothetical protein
MARKTSAGTRNRSAQTNTGLNSQWMIGTGGREVARFICRSHMPQLVFLPHSYHSLVTVA